MRTAKIGFCGAIAVTLVTFLVASAQNSRSKPLPKGASGKNIAFAVPVMENAIARHEKDLNQLGKIAHTARTFGNIALAVASGAGIAILIYLYYHLAPLLFSK